VQRDRATLERAERPRTLRRANGPRDARACRGTARRYSVQRNRAMPRRAEGPRDATACRGTARRHIVQRDRETLQRADTPCNATWCRETARRHVVQRGRATLRGAERPRDATACRGKSCKLKSFCDRVVDRSTTGRFGPASGRTVRALPIPPDTRRRRTDSEYAESQVDCSKPFQTSQRSNNFSALLTAPYRHSAQLARAP